MSLQLAQRLDSAVHLANDKGEPMDPIRLNQILNDLLVPVEESDSVLLACVVVILSGVVIVLIVTLLLLIRR
jgi:hypothetical protein